MRLEINQNQAEIIKGENSHVLVAENSTEITQMLRQGIAEAKSGNRNEARILLTQVVESEPKNENAWLWLASISEYPEELLVFLQNVLSINPDNQRANEWTKQTKSLLAKNIVQRGINASQENQKDVAKQCFLQAIAHDNQNEMAWFWLASIVESADEKISNLKKVLSINPNNEMASSSLKMVKKQMAQAVLKKANQAIVLGDRETAGKLLQEAMKHDETCEEVWLLKAHLTDSFDEKIGHFNKVLAINPENESAKSGLFMAESIVKSATAQSVDREDVKVPEQVDTVSQKQIQNSIEESISQNAVQNTQNIVEEVVSEVNSDELVVSQSDLDVESNLEADKLEVSEESQTEVAEFNETSDVQVLQNEPQQDLNTETDNFELQSASENHSDDFQDIHKTTEANIEFDENFKVSSVNELENVDQVAESFQDIHKTTEANIEFDEKFNVSSLNEFENVDQVNESNTESEMLATSETFETVEPQMQSEVVEPESDVESDDDNLLELHENNAANSYQHELDLSSEHTEDKEPKEIVHTSFLNFNPEKVSNEVGTYSFSRLKPEEFRNSMNNYSFAPSQSDEVEAENSVTTAQELDITAEQNEAETVVENTVDFQTKEFSDFQQATQFVEVETPNELSETPNEVSYETAQAESYQETPSLIETESGQNNLQSDESSSATNGFEICHFCRGANAVSEIKCNSCNAVIKVSDLRIVLENKDVNKDIVFEAIQQKELEKMEGGFSVGDYQILGIAYLNVGDLQNGYENIKMAAYFDPSNADLNSLMVSLTEKFEQPQSTEAELNIERQENNATNNESTDENIETTQVSHTVMVVDDSPTVRKLISTKLERHGHTVVSAVDGMDALAKINEVVPDLILLDITMPRLDGYQVCKLIRNNDLTKSTPIVMISGKDGFFDKVRGRMAGSTDFISKPFGPEVLMKMLETYIH